MDEQTSQKPVNPRRKKRSQMQIFKETYLPVIIAGLSLVMILIFIIGAIGRGIQNGKAAKEASIQASESEAAAYAQLEDEANRLITGSQTFAAGYDYDRAIAVIDTFSGDISQFPKLTELKQQYTNAKSSLVAWNDPAQVTNLSFMPLMVDTQRAFADDVYGEYYNRRYVTIGEFQKILEQLYTNNYVLVGMDDIVSGTDGSYSAGTVYLPEGKKPIMITQVNVSYPYQLVDGNNDLRPDKDGDGFASKLVLDENGNLACEYVDDQGQTLVGAYDLVPILNAFVKEHPDFSYRGAKATLAVTGYNGVFGYRIQADAERTSGTALFEKEKAAVKDLAEALRSDGYDLACYTYGDIGYGDKDVSTVKEDLASWTEEIAPVLGDVSIFVFAQSSDIADKDKEYSGDKYSALQNAGFRIFMGNASDGKAWISLKDSYVRQGRVLVSGTTMAYNSDWFTGMFDAKSVLDSSRGDVPQ